MQQSEFVRADTAPNQCSGIHDHLLLISVRLMSIALNMCKCDLIFDNNRFLGVHQQSLGVVAGSFSNTGGKSLCKYGLIFGRNRFLGIYRQGMGVVAGGFDNIGGNSLCKCGSIFGSSRFLGVYRQGLDVVAGGASVTPATNGKHV